MENPTPVPGQLTLDDETRRLSGRAPCDCGCREIPVGRDSKYKPGHDLRDAYAKAARSV